MHKILLSPFIHETSITVFILLCPFFPYPKEESVYRENEGTHDWALWVVQRLEVQHGRGAVPEMRTGECYVIETMRRQ